MRVHGYESRCGYGFHFWRGDHEGVGLVAACIAAGVDHAAVLGRPDPGAPLVVERDGFSLRLFPLAWRNRKRLVLRVEGGERTYVLKRVNRGSLNWSRLFPGVFGLSYFTRVMRRVGPAVERGCGAVQDVLVVAERGLGLSRQDAWVLLEYIDGVSVGMEGGREHESGMVACAEELLRYGLTLDDVSRGNFLWDGERVRAIDMSCRDPECLERAKMIEKIRVRYGYVVPKRRFLDRLLCGLVGLRYRVRLALGGKV